MLAKNMHQGSVGFRLMCYRDVRPGKVLHDHLPLNSYAREIEGARNLVLLSSSVQASSLVILHYLHYIGVLVLSHENRHETRSYNSHGNQPIDVLWHCS